MILNFLDKLGGFLDRRFIVAYWAPAFLSLGLAASVHALHVGVAPALELWTAQNAVQRIVMGLAILLVVTVAAYLLQSFTSSVVRLFEGYTWPTWAARWAAHWHCVQARQLNEERKRGGAPGRVAQLRRYVGFPPLLEHVRPTRLGNVLTSAEQYPESVYGLNGVLWWPRLFPLLPAGLATQIGSALVPMLALLNLCGGFVLTALAGAAYLTVADARPWPAPLVFIGGLGSAWVCYESAVTQAAAYGNLVRSTFDLHRHDLLRKLGTFVPETVQDEKILWRVLNEWIYNFKPPEWHAHITSPPRHGVTRGDPHPEWLTDPFRYDGKVPDAASSPAERGMDVTLRIGWLDPDAPPPGGDA